MKKWEISLTVVCLILVTALCYGYASRSEYNAIKYFDVSYLGTCKTVGEGLKLLEDNGASVNWQSSRITNSKNHNIYEVDVNITGKDISGKQHDAQISFSVNYDLGSNTIEYYVVDGKQYNKEDASKLLVTGTF